MAPLTISAGLSSASIWPLVVGWASLMFRLLVCVLKLPSLSCSLGESPCSFHDTSDPDRDEDDSCDSVSSDSELALVLVCWSINGSVLLVAVDVELALTAVVDGVPPVSVLVRRAAAFSRPANVLFILSCNVKYTWYVCTDRKFQHLHTFVIQTRQVRKFMVPTNICAESCSRKQWTWVTN